MIRRVAVTVLALALAPVALSAQAPVFTVTVASADVHKGPSTVTPVIGHVTNGTALDVSRNLGSWIRIAWPAAPDGVAYVHVTMGRLSGAGTEPSALPAPATPARPQQAVPAAISASPQTPARSHTAGDERIGVQGPHGVTTISHIVGIGAVLQSSQSFGATGRVWRGERFGLELRVTRNTLTSDAAAGRVTSTEVEPRVVYRLFDHVSDYFWLRPYLGSGVNLSRQTLNASSPAALATQSATHVGARLFGGSEVTFAGATRFGLSAELGYRPPSTAFTGYDTKPYTVSIAGHWYVK